MSFLDDLLKMAKPEQYQTPDIPPVSQPEQIQTPIPPEESTKPIAPQIDIESLIQSLKGNQAPAAIPSTPQPKQQTAPDLFANLINNDSDIKKRYEDKKAQNERAILINQLGAAADKIGSSISGTKADSSGYENNIKQFQQQAPNLQEMKNLEELDPNSQVSAELRGYAKKYGVTLPPNVSADNVKQILPMVYKDYENRQHAKERREDLALKYKELGVKQDAVRQEKMDTADTKRFDTLNKELVAEKASSRSAFGVAARNYQSIENAKALLAGEIDPNNLDSRQIYELSRTLDRILSQGGATISGTEHLNPDTARGWLAKATEYISNKRQGAQAGDFVNNMSHTLEREEDVAKDQILRTQKQFLSGYKDLYKRHPEKFNDILEGHGIPNNVFEGHQQQMHSEKQPASEQSMKKTPPNGLMTINQKGHTYNWNSETGKYE